MGRKNKSISPNMNEKKSKAQASKNSSPTKKEEEKGLSSPTSVTMMNSFIVKNADESFDTYYHQMKRRKGAHHGMDQTMTTESKFGLVFGKKPTARDGHSSNLDKNGFMYVFGGDRHHMPFNDLYIIKLPH